MNSNLRTKVVKINHAAAPDVLFYTEWQFDTQIRRHILMLIRNVAINLPAKVLQVDYLGIATNSLRVKTELIPELVRQIPIVQSAPVGATYEFNLVNNSLDCMYLLGKHFKPADSALGPIPPKICNSYCTFGWLDPSAKLSFKAVVVEKISESRLVCNNWRFDYKSLTNELVKPEYLEDPKLLFYKIQAEGQIFDREGCQITIPSNGQLTLPELFTRIKREVSSILDQWEGLLSDNFGNPVATNITLQRATSTNIGSKNASYVIQLPDILHHISSAFRIHLDEFSDEKEKYQGILARFDNNRQTSALIVQFAGSEVDFAASMLIAIKEFRTVINDALVVPA